MPSRQRESPILSTRSKAIGLLAAISAATIAAHLFNPTNWPPLGIDILHALHGPGFSVLALIVLWFLQSQCRSLINYLLAGAIAISIGVISEIAQIPGPRDAQFGDLLVDALGISGGLGVRAAFDKRARAAMGRWTRLALPVAAGAALSVACFPALWYGYALLQQQRLFPSLLVFENAWERATLSQNYGGPPDFVAGPDEWPDPGSSIAYAEEYGRSGIFLSLHPLPDWRGYARLSFTAASATASAFPMAFCILDAKPDKETRRNRFCKDIVLSSTVAEYSVEFSEIEKAMPLRPFDFSRVSSVAFSASNPGAGNALLIDNVRLEM